MSSKSASKPGSLARRLTFWYAGATFALSVAAMIYVYMALLRNLAREDDDELIDQVRILQHYIGESPPDIEGLRKEVEWESLARRKSRIFLRVMNGGRVVSETPGMEPGLTNSVFPEPLYDPKHGHTHDVRGGKTYRIIAGREGGYVILAALDRSEEEELLAKFGLGIIPALLGLLALSALIGYRIARRGIRPVEEIAETARRIRSTTLNERIAASDLPLELATLAGTFNEMLDRLEESFARLSRFSADIAHELRTPVNNLRGEVEVALGKARTPEEYRELLASNLEECRRLTRIIDSLLFLARAENPETQVRRERLSLGKELGAVREFYEATAGEQGVTLKMEAAEGVEANLDRTLLQRAVGNLVENALAHTPRGGAITLSASRDNGSVKVEVADTGKGIPPEHLPHVFDRFYRVDPSRTAASGGVGLGLAIVKSIAELHGGKAEIASDPGRGTRVTLLFPTT